jgi:penicillin-binding protein 1A
LLKNRFIAFYLIIRVIILAFWQVYALPFFNKIFHYSIYNFKNFKKLKWYLKPASLIYTIILSIAIYVTAVEINFLWLFGSMPGTNMVFNPDLNVASEIYSADGKLIGKYFKEHREPVTYHEINQETINALIVTEDVRFFKHYGIDFKGIAGAAYSTIQGDKRGGSTLTQQLVKNLFKTRRKKSSGILGYIPGVRTLIAKSKEWITAVKIELFYTKQEILTMYLNTVEFGHNTYGIKVAALNYFGVLPAQLTYPQAAMLIGMLKAPSYYSPLKHPQRCIERRNIVLAQLLKYNKITRQEYEEYSKAPLGVNYNEYNYNDGIAPYFRTAVAKQLEKWQQESGYNIYTDGLIIHTTLNAAMQENAERAVAVKMKELQERFKIHWAGSKPWLINATKQNPHGILTEIIKKSQRYKNLKKKYVKDENAIMQEMNKPVNMKIFTWSGIKEKEMSPIDSIKHYLEFLHCGLITLDPYNGHVLAYVGGINYEYFKYDHASIAENQPGSTFKPFVYTTAIEKGYGPCDRLLDAPVSIKYTENGEIKTWSPHNADWVTTGKPMTLRHAMGRSVNTVTARLTEKVGWTEVAKTARKMGIKSPLKEVPSIGLGSNDVKLIEMVAAYAVYLNNGKYIEPVFVTKITDRQGNVIAEFKPSGKQVLSEETAWLMTYMLRGGIEEPGGTSQALWEYKFVHGNEVGGKTGTSSNYADGWYIGITKDFVTGVWVGADDNRIRFRTSETGEGARTALPVYGKYMDLNYSDKRLMLTKGKLPKARVKITKPLNCPTLLPKTDTLPATNNIPENNTNNESIEL